MNPLFSRGILQSLQFLDVCAQDLLAAQLAGIPNSMLGTTVAFRSSYHSVRRRSAIALLALAFLGNSFLCVRPVAWEIGTPLPCHVAQQCQLSPTARLCASSHSKLRQLGQQGESQRRAK